MTTVVNNPGASSDSGSSMGMVVGILLIVVVAFLFFVYGLPALRSTSSGSNVTPVPQVVVPNKIDVNVQPAK